MPFVKQLRDDVLNGRDLLHGSFFPHKKKIKKDYNLRWIILDYD